MYFCLKSQNVSYSMSNLLKVLSLHFIGFVFVHAGHNTYLWIFVQGTPKGFGFMDYDSSYIYFDDSFFHFSPQSNIYYQRYKPSIM